MSDPETAAERELDPESLPETDPGYGADGDSAGADGALVDPGSTATGAGTGELADPAEVGTTEADVSDGSEQKQEPID